MQFQTWLSFISKSVTVLCSCYHAFPVAFSVPSTYEPKQNLLKLLILLETVVLSQQQEEWLIKWQKTGNAHLHMGTVNANHLEGSSIPFYHGQTLEGEIGLQ